MKKILLSILIVFALGAGNNTQAQCDLSISNTVITPIGDPIPTDGGCQYVFNASFDIITNSGFKALFFHTWKASEYPSTPVFSCEVGNQPAVDPPTSAVLGTALGQAGKSIMDIGFYGLNTVTFPANTPVPVTSYFANVYLTDPSVVLTNTTTSPGMTATITRKGTSDTLHFDVTNIHILVAGDCTDPLVSATTAIWGSNAGALDNTKAQCYICGTTQSIDDPDLALVPTCITTASGRRQYSFSVTTAQPNATLYNYFIYAHDPNNIAPDFLINSGNVTLSTDPNDSYDTHFSSGLLAITQGGYCCVSPWSEWSLRLQVTSPSFSNTIATQNLNLGCSPLPVNLKLFTAVRKNSSTVDLKWETAQEDNNRGFYIQRMLSNGEWKDVGYVASKAFKGNSTSPLSYEFIDLNNAKGISQYRLRQLDIDGKLSYSQIRAVRGEGQNAKTIVYPNPSGDGKVNIVFEDARSIRDVSVLDITGRTVKQWKGVTNNNIQIENLTVGFYSVRIVNIETGEQVVEKFIVNKR